MCVKKKKPIGKEEVAFLSEKGNFCVGPEEDQRLLCFCRSNVMLKFSRFANLKVFFQSSDIDCLSFCPLKKNKLMMLKICVKTYKWLFSVT